MGSKTTKQKAQENNSKARKTNEPIVVAQIMGKWVGGGVEAVIMNYYRHIDRTKVQFDFICDDDSTNIPYEEIEKLGGKVILCPPYQKLPKYLKFLKQLFKEKKYRIVHSNINTLSVFPLYAAKKAGVPVRIAHSHSTSNPKEWKKHLIKSILRLFGRKYATDLFACTRYAGVFQFGKTKEEQVRIIEDAIDVEAFRFDNDARDRLRKELGLDQFFVVGNVGRLVPVKNQLFLLEILPQLKRLNSKTKLLIVGDGELYETINSSITKRGLEDDVIIVGHCKNINDYYSVMDVFAFPSIYEGFGMAALEAQINGLPVVVSKNVPTDIKVAKAVEYLDLKNVDEWAKVIANYQGARNANSVSSDSIAKYNILNSAEKLANIYIDLGAEKWKN